MPAQRRSASKAAGADYRLHAGRRHKTAATPRRAPTAITICLCLTAPSRGRSNCLTYLSGGTTVKANTYVQSPDGERDERQSLWRLFCACFRARARPRRCSAGLSTALGSNTGSNFLYAGGSLVSGRSLDIESNGGGGLSINSALNIGTGKFILNAAGKITESGAGKITASSLTGSSHGAVTLNAANIIANLGAFTTNNGNLALTDAALLTTTGTVNAGTHTITLKTNGGNESRHRHQEPSDHDRLCRGGDAHIRRQRDGEHDDGRDHHPQAQRHGQDRHSR